MTERRRQREISRRTFLRLGASATGATLATAAVSSASAVEGPQAAEELTGVLVDTTRCIGCRQCEQACATANGWPMPDLARKSAFEQPRTTSPEAWTVVNRVQTSRGEVFVKRQCMHCNSPACASACLVRAMRKTEKGPVIWQPSKCMGCRYCMVACPFDVPKFEYGKAIPTIQKCNFCAPRLAKGQLPACVEACPTQALTFGTRRELIIEARNRTGGAPGRYCKHVFGEADVGGTSWMYIAAVTPDQLGFNTNLGTEAYPDLTAGFMGFDPVVFVLWSSFLLGISKITGGREKEGHEALLRARAEGDKRAEKAAAEGVEKGKAAAERTAAGKIATLEKKLEELTEKPGAKGADHG